MELFYKCVLGLALSLFVIQASLVVMCEAKSLLPLAPSDIIIPRSLTFFFINKCRNALANQITV